MKLHLPKSLRNAVLACITAVAGISTTVGTAVFTGGVVSFTLAGVAMAVDATSESGNQTLSHSGGNFTWNTTTGDFSNGDETVAFTQGDSVIFNATSTINFGESLTAHCVTIAEGADVTISGDGTGSLALETAEVYGTLKLRKGGANGSFTGDVDVYGTLDFAAGDVTGWSNSLGIKSIDVFEGGRLHVSVAGGGNNQTGAGLAINLMGGSITGVSNANLDLGYGGSTYGYSSISARAAADATAENPIVSTVSGTNLTLRQNATTISVAENARLDISSGILVASGKAPLNSEGSVPAGITAGLSKTGVGELRLSGNNTYTQATTVAEGTLTLTGGASLASSSITVNAGAVFCMDTAENTSFSYNNTVRGAGELRKIGAGSATLSYLYNNFTGTIALEEGSLRVGQSLTINSGRELSLGLYGAVLDSNLSLGDGKLSIDYSGGGAATSLNHSALTLLGGTQLQLSNLGSVDGRVFDLFTGIGSLQGSNGSTLVLDPTNNAVANYFDISLLNDTSLWNNAILQMTSDGTLQIVRGNGEMKAPLTITSRQVVELSEYNLQCFESVAFENIDASASRGGAIDGVNIALTDNGNVSFTGNTASSSGSSVYGGAIDGNVTATGNGKVSFIGNVASGSTYCYGGAIHTYGDITLNNNGSVTFGENTVSGSYVVYGGAIYTYGDLSIRNNDSVAFYQNAEVNEGSYRLRSIYAGGSGDKISLSAAAGKSITFRDSIYIGSGSSFKLNEDYEGQAQQGDIIFTGVTTVQDLKIVKGNVAGTSAEILASRTSEINAATLLYGGRLRVEEGAIYQGKGITAVENSAATVRVKDASLLHAGFDLTFNAGTTLELVGNNSVSGNVQMLEGSSLLLNLQETFGVTDVDGNFDFSGNMTLALSSDESWTCENGVLMYVNGELSGWNAERLTVTGAGTYSTADIRWVDNMLVLNYNADTFNKYYNGSATYTTLQPPVLYHHYETIRFADIEGNPTGGAVYGTDGSSFSLSHNGSVEFIGNSANFSDTVYGGAIYAGEGISLHNNASVIFRENSASVIENNYGAAYGGAIFGYGDIALSYNGIVEFSGNAALAYSSYGGAIYGYGDISLSNNGSVSFSQNTAYESGGAIYGDYCDITLRNNTSVIFSRNTAAYLGGAIYGDYCNISLSDNGSVEFIRNTADAGGAIYGDYCNISLSNNTSVIFIGNSASGDGGAIDGYYCDITLCNNGSISFAGNTAATGGAICSDKDLSIRNNDSVAFYQNAEVNEGSYRLRSIYAGGSGDKISLSAAAGKNITFGDSIYIGSGSSFRLNEDYTYQNEEGVSVTVKQEGDIIFTGADTEQHLNDLLEAAGAGRTATSEEILASRITEVNAVTHLYGGRLRVEDGAVYQGQGITAYDGSAATVIVKNATLNHEGYNLNFQGGTTLGVLGGSFVSGNNVYMSSDAMLELAGDNTIVGDVRMWGSSTLLLNAQKQLGMTDVLGVLDLNDRVTVALSNDESWTCENGILMYVSGGAFGWDAENLTVTGAGTYGASDLSWVDNMLILNYNVATFNSYFNGTVTYTSRQTSPLHHHYESIGFNDITSISNGGAIDGDVTMKGNGDITFIGNTAESTSTTASGGAIYGTVTMEGNRAVTFSGNSAESDSSPCGGAIYGTVTMEGNGAVTFSGNSASGRYARGGAIYGDSSSSIALSNNGIVKFSENTVTSTDSYGDVYGGAIYAYGNLSIRNNDFVLFEKNAEINNGNYRLRSIYAGGSGDKISLSTASGKNIIFGDSIYIGYDSSFKLNEDYTYQNEEGVSVTIKQQGDIIFSGKKTEQRLNELLAAAGVGRTATCQEIYDSRTTEVNTLTELYGGRLCVEEGAIYQGRGITAMAGSGATVRVQNATLSHSGYDLTFNAGTTLELVGNNTISGNVQMQEGSTLLLNAQEILGVTDFAGKLNLTEGIELALSNDSTWTCENGILMYVNGTLSGWDAENLTVTGAGTYNSSNVRWVDNLLVLNYNADTFNKYYNGSVTHTTCQHSSLYHHYETIRFKGITGASTGGVICVNGDIALNNNGSVVFEGNSSGLGGAIYGGYDNDISLCDNDSLEFIGNAASDSGGAIYGGVTMTGNREVSFSGNTVSGVGGAIYGDSISLCDNGGVEFIGNAASNSGGAIYGGIINLNGNESLLFQGNKAIGNDPSGWDGYGGAIADVAGGGRISLMGNKSVAFIENVATTAGGAIDASRYDYMSHRSDSSIEITRNGSVEFINNRVDGISYPVNGGAIASNNLSVCDNGDVSFVGNVVSSSLYGDDRAIPADGGAIYTFGDLSIRNNDLVEFYQNAEVNNGIYRLRSIYASGGALSAAAGKSITFRDSIYIGSESTFKLNEAFEGTAQQGDIIFTGETTVDDLYTVKGNVAGTEEEILASRTTEVRGMTNLYGGRLRVEEGAIYQGRGITAREGSAATVRVQNAELNHVGYDLEFNAGTALEVVGESTIRGHVNLQECSVFKLELGAVLCLHETAGADAATLSVSGTALLSGTSTLNAGLTLADGATLDMDNLAAGAVTLNGALTFSGQVSIGDNLLALLEDIKAQTEGLVLFTGIDSLTLPDVATTTASGRMWAGSVFSNLTGQNYYLDYKAETGTLSIVSIPEPATATLSLLALAALAARRRRKS